MKEREAAGNVSMDTIEGDESPSQSPYHEAFCLITKVNCGHWSNELDVLPLLFWFYFHLLFPPPQLFFDNLYVEDVTSSNSLWLNIFPSYSHEPTNSL